ncbi:hypothetical protein ACIBF6_20865 [Streptosporangium amethystogenes]|uniref:hypothetical protein n=1 Tax=Streptosporangium amethystogenes TaxID=2002 RepID=UPI0037BC7DCB
MKEKVLAFYRHDYERAGSKSSPWTEPDLPDPGFAQMGMVAIVLDEEEGLGFHPDFDLLQEVFANPALIVRGRYREVVSGYLRGDDAGPRILRRLTAKDPGKASKVFRKLLKKPRFSWEHDGEALLRKHKADCYDGPRLPRVIPV